MAAPVDGSQRAGVVRSALLRHAVWKGSCALVFRLLGLFFFLAAVPELDLRKVLATSDSRASNSCIGLRVYETLQLLTEFLPGG